MTDFGFTPDEHNYFFISYYSRNEETLNRTRDICNELHKLGINLWYDKGIGYGNDWQKTITEHIGKSNVVIVFVSNELLSSNEEKGESGVLLEYDIAINQKKKVVVPIFINSINNKNISDIFGVFFSSISRKQGIYVEEKLSAIEAAKKIYRELKDIIGISSSSQDGNKNNETITKFKSYSKEITALMNWLINLKAKWGTYDISETPQIANTCEAILAMKATGYDKIKPKLYKNALSYVLNNVTENGLYSKSLNCETTIHTAMLLLIAALEKNNSSGIILDFSIFDRIAKNLWDKRNEEYGWGTYIENTSNEDCSIANTYWALRALSNYLPQNRLEYFEFVKQFYEFEDDGTFGFFIGGQSRLITSAMFLELYYCLRENEQLEIKHIFPLKKCISFVYNRTIYDNIQVETESFFESAPPLLSCFGRKRAPWNHICIGFVLSSLVKAYDALDLCNNQFIELLKFLDSIIEKQIVELTDNKKMFSPKGIENPKYGFYTFPTIHLLIGLSQVEQVLKKEGYND